MFSMKATGRSTVHVMSLPGAPARANRCCSTLNFEMKCGTSVASRALRSAPPRSTLLYTKCRTPAARLASTSALPCRSSDAVLAPDPNGVCTANTPQMGVDVSVRAVLKMADGASRFPGTSFTRGDFCARACAEGDVGERVSARISNGGEALERSSAFMTEEPCLPVAPVMRMALVAIFGGSEGEK